MASKTVGSWRPFTARDRKRIEAHLHAPDGSRCPQCGDILEAPVRIGSLCGDLECHDCKRYYSRNVEVEVPRVSPEAIYLLRLQRLATAVIRV